MEDEVMMESKMLSSVRYLKVYPPPNRMGDYCYIYGKISVNDDRANTPVTLFSRRKDNPQRITLGDDDFSFLALSDHESDRALSAFFRPLYVNMRLYEIDVESSSEEEELEEEDESSSEELEEGESSSEEEELEEEEEKKEGVLIANIVGFKIRDDLLNLGRNYFMSGKCGFSFKISYAVIYGARAEVEVKINRPDNTENLSLFGYVDARENLEGGADETSVVLYENVATPVVFGAPFPLARRFVVAPAGVTSAASLSIQYEFRKSHSNTVFAHGFLTFPMKRGSRPDSFLTNKDRTHVKHGPGNLVSVSIKFLDENLPGFRTP